MAHVPEKVTLFVCESCQVTYAGTPIHQPDGTHLFEAPEPCGVCDGSSFIKLQDWLHHHD